MQCQLGDLKAAKLISKENSQNVKKTDIITSFTYQKEKKTPTYTADQSSWSEPV